MLTWTILSLKRANLLRLRNRLPRPKRAGTQLLILYNIHKVGGYNENSTPPIKCMRMRSN